MVRQKQQQRVVTARVASSTGAAPTVLHPRHQHSRPWHHCWLLLLLLLLLGASIGVGCSPTSSADLERRLDDSPIALNLAIPLAGSGYKSSGSFTPRLTTRQLARKAKIPLPTTGRPPPPQLLQQEQQQQQQTSAINQHENAAQHRFRFTSSHYNVSIPENSMSKTYVTPEEKMGIELKGADRRLYDEIKFRIVSGDKDKFFKAEERVVGDFCFLLLRMRTGTLDVLNRERKDKYVLDIRASARRHHGGGKNRQQQSNNNNNLMMEAQTSVTVTVLDTNDLNPLFYPTEYEITVTEDTPVHRSIIKVMAEDADLGRNGEIYYSFSEKTEQFAVHPVSGVVSLTRPLRFMEKSDYDLTVLARDRGVHYRNAPRASSAKLTIHVQQVNLHAPEISVRHLPEIMEHSNADTYAIVRVTDRDPGPHGQIASLDIVAGDPDGHFRVRPLSNSESGEYSIQVLKLLDRETAPQGYNLTLRATDRGTPPRSSYKSVPVHLADLNDNAPIFSREIYEVKVPETAPVNSPIIRLKVSDADQGKNALVFLEIVGGNEGGEFYVNADTGMLYTAVPLDFEKKAFYTLTVSAVDQGNSGTRKQSSAKVKVYVIDTNDNDPEFEHDSMTVEMDENEPAGTSVVRVVAKDRDSGENAYISYSIDNIKRVPFEIDHFSGIVRTKQLLDYETMKRDYLLHVRANDWGLPYRRQSEMQLRVRLRNVNDNRPQFEKVDCVGQLARNSPVGTEIITVSAMDFDAGNIISYQIVSGNGDGCFSLDQTSGVLSVACDLADLKSAERIVNVTATDGTHFADVNSIAINLVNGKRNPGSGQQQSKLLADETGNFQCHDTGVARRLTEAIAQAEKNNMPSAEDEYTPMPSRYGENVHAPEFVDLPNEIRVNESAPLGSVLAKLVARDRDLGYNGKLVFGISAGDRDSVFEIDPDSGELRVIGRLDRERESEYFLNITVYDLGKPQKSASRMLPVTVLDVNDNPPKFEKALASFRIPENVANGTVIFRANATDPDLGDNAKIAYTLVTDTADFYIDRSTGVLSVNGKLDRERQDSYELRIRATDRNGGDDSKSEDVDLENSPLYSEALVHVYVDDVNDNAPAFALNSYTVKVREDVPIWSVVAIVEATDPDEGLGGTIVYSFSEDLDNDGGGFFEIDPLSGTVRTIQKLDFEDRQVHTLTIRASDKGEPALSSETILIVEIVDVNENVFAPVFSDFVVSATIYENQPVGSLVTQVRAKDADAPGIDSRISYSIRGGDGVGLFGIDDEGNIKTKAVLDVETKNGYWLTVYAQDHGVVPLSSKLQVYVEVLDENDNTPLTELPVYYPSVLENSPAGVSVVQIRAFDRDVTPQQFTFSISSGNAEGYFLINSTSGLITTSGRKLDRENQAEHILEVTVRDDGRPALSSTTRVVVQVEDVNDHGPMFEEKFYIVQIPASPPNLDKPLFQKNERNRNARAGGDALTSPGNSETANIAGAGGGSEIVEMSVDALLENGTWETFSPDSLTGDRIFRVLAHDEDIGKNGKIQYSIKSGKGKGKFKIHPNTGMVYSQKGFEAGQEFDMIIKASDEGEPPRSHQARISVQVVETPRDSPNAPQFKSQNQSVEVTESDQVGYLVALMQATDKDGDTLWYDIVDGDPRDEFVIGRDNGNVLLAKQLDWETQKSYVLTVAVTDGVNEARTQLRVKVIDINDHRPEFSEPLYRVQISENLVERGERVLQLHAEDADEDKRVFYSLHNAQNQASLRLFHVDSITGALTLNEPLDRETIEEHVLTVMVKDQGTPPKRNYARVLVTVHDHNDHAPLFISEIVQAKVYETAPIGTEVVQVVAVDWDRGDNARLSYSMTSGNVGNVFSIDAELGIIRVARELDLASSSEYILLVKATDHGSPPLASSIPVHVMVTMADNAAPRFVKQPGNNGELAAEIYENEPPGSFVKHLEARATSSLQYYIVEGNIDEAFFVNPSTGVITTQDRLDYEKLKFYNLTIEATSMAGSAARCNVIVHVLDRNDNVPRFLQAIYTGQISEAASIGSLVFSSNSTSSPLVIKAEDADSELNALLNYDIVEELPRKFFHIDSSTGAIRTVMLLDHETIPSFEFHVKVSDLGKPRLSSETTAKVLIAVTDVNDCPPKFRQSEYNATVLVPTWRNVAVVKLEAFDPDTTNALPGQTSLRYDIIDGNQAQAFQINSQTGALTISNPENMAASYLLHVRASDGKYSSVAQVNINVENSENSGLVFQKDSYEGTVLENSTKITTVAVLHVLGTVLNEHVVFTILNPTDLFVIGQTSGAISTTGVRFDRESCDRYELVVEAKSLVPKKRVAHVIVNVTVLDINDNCPIFVNLPYYAVVSVDAQKSDVIMKVHAVDLDSGDNGEVRYELKKGYGELFKVARKTGEISLKQNLEGHNREYQLTIAAYDGGISPCSVEVPVNLKVIDRSMPVFDKQFYSVSVLESIEVHSPLSVAIQAESPLNRKLIYSITKGNDFEEFALDFNTALDSNNGPCVIYVVDELDYEEKKEYELTVRATDSVSGIYAEVLVSILVLDVNDCPPEFSQDSYNVSISEAAIFGTELLRLVARDNDTGINQQIIYAIENRTDLGENIADLFHIDPEEGIVYLKRSLDHETADSHHFTVIATDRGVPSLSSTAHVWLTVIDMNDNPPKFDQPSYNCFLSEEAERGQFVTVLSASDPDLSDERLIYTIVGGNEQQTYSIDQSTGILTLINMQNFAEEKMTVLNVSVSDGVYTSFARVKIDILPANRHAPKFSNPIIEASVQENKPAGRLVASVVATDEDFGEYGAVRYSISSDYMQEFFEIHPERGDIVTKKCLDREQHKLFEIPIVASDGGGKAGFVIVRVKVIDDNDNTPVFLLKEYKACIHSNYTVNSVFLKVKAVDADDGDNAKIEYSILEPSNSEIKNIFGIKPDTGALFLKESPKSYENQLFQLFIRAKDKGPNSRHVDVPLDVFVMGSNDVPPLFERKDDKFFVSETSPIGTPITRLKTVNNTNRTITCRIVSSGNDFPFIVDPKNCSVTLSASLDREKKDSYLIGVLAETDSSPPLTALAEISLHVLDENDHAPEFESNPYSVGVAENIAEGTSILKVIAHDDDLGSNGEVRYSFGTDIGELANVFTIDAYTGWISNLVQLDKEKQPEYKFQVVATDNGNPRHFARTSVLVKLKDYNDHSPEFVTTEAGYQATVKEDALPGTVVVELTTTDKDVDMNTPVDYYITAGDPRSQFAIRSTGQVYVAKALDRETIDRYELTVVGTDGKFVFETKVTIQVLDVNDNPPYCLRYRYREVLSEGSHPGIYVLTVLATDYDDEPNAKLRFYLTGDKNEKFSLDKETGVLKTVGQLDRETQAKYLLTAHVQDRDKPSWECSSQLEIVISDLNDNAPKFSQQSYSATLPEDVEIGTLVTKVHATDDDIGINRKIRYEFIDSANEHFTISSDSGIVTLAKPLDRETQAMYNVSIRAMDQGVPQLQSITYLIVNVQDINDNPPEFTSKYYFARVPEIDAVGTEVARVLATSKDTGVNADVYYSIVGGNEHKKFQINRLTGAISIAEQLDYERAKDYYLTIQAIDGGVPPLTNHATVNITVLDSNDNAPIFSQSSYRGSVNEAASLGEAVVQVSAIDLDSNENGQVSYTIERGDRQKQFAIDPKTGLITVAAALDREQTATYNLEIHAKDAGLPTMSNYVVVTVDIEDANDNPPLFDQANYTAVVQEDRAQGHPVLRFKVTDADAAENAAPYTFDFREGNDGDAFRLEQDGTLRTAIKFNSRVRDRYRLHVRVFDNGTPPLYSDTWVEVKIIEESQYPPVITLLEINVNSYRDEYPGGVIGRVHASDKDQYDTLQYALVPTSPSRPNTDLFQIDKHDGTLVALPRLDVGEYRVNVSVTDGKYTSYSIAKVNIELISDDMLENSVIVRFREVSPEDFVLKHRRGFLRTVRNAMKCRPKDVLILSIQPSTEAENNVIKSRSARQAGAVVHNDLDVLFAVRKPDPSEFYTSASIREALNQHIEELEASTKLVVEDIVRYKCSKGHCVYGECRDRVVLEPQHISPIATDVVAFVSPRHRHRTECSCKEGYAGQHCEVVVNECARSPCPGYRVCVPDSSVQGYSCQCAEGFAGQSCEIDMSKCHDGSCYIPRNPISFSGKSYARYKVDESQASSTIEKQLSLSLRIRTVQPTGNLMYAAGKIDYNVLEIVNGAVQYRFDLGSGEGLVRVNSFYISDGQWHEIELQRDSNTASLSIDGKHLAHGSAPGVNDILNLQSDELYLGAEVRQHPAILGFEDVQRGFVGCMDDVRLARQSVPLHVSGSASGLLVLKRFANVEFSCEATSVLSPPGVCGSQPCQNGGTCSESKNDSDDDGYECQCHARFRGRNCEIDTDPCASSPCLYAGRCRVLHELGDYECECVGPNLTGKRCEFGRYCNPNPCKNGGVCEEGNSGPICKCQGYAGERCELDVNECERNPCANGATCLNELGTYRCVCPPGTTGLNCANPASYATGLITHKLHITWEHLMWIGVAIVVNIVLIVIFVSCRTLANKRRRTAANNINNETRKELVLNSTRPNDHEYKRSSKLSNLEVVQRECPPQCPPRPASYTPSSNNEQQVLLGCTSAAAVALNNLDTLRSYGSAGDELENFPPDYLRNLNRNTGSSNGGTANTMMMQQQQPQSIMPDLALDKPSWQEQMQLASFISDATKIKNDLKRASPVVSESTTGGLLLNSIRRPAIHTGGTSIASLSSIEDDPRIVGGYHWDCSDWVRPSHNPLPNITEVPGSEVPDSSSFHSNESNESNTHQVPLLHIGSLDPTRDITTLNEDQESEYVGDSECGTDLSEHYYLHKHHEPLLLSDSSVTQRLNPLDSGSGEAEYKYRSSESYLRHPNTYLPHYNIHTDTESEQQSQQQPLNGGGGGGSATTRLLTANKKKNNGVLGGILASDDEHDNNEDDEDEDQDLDDDDEDNVVPYGFPSARRNRCARATDLVIGTLDERNSLLGNGNGQNGANNSNSDLSTHLCEIDDADFEIAQQKQSNGRAWHVGGVTQTSV
ncbi:fat-like cadherin-related tumor suppressor homolog isoform X1 [Trichogramma pretiosum]|uniref:fat-like cadherin-related tumor suppressor homolog isoform X1 n=1 Tax=Trichogramma pretiosum TaxID=7493 RepID=UPI000C71A29C|nr:fat-like cadherin-related tumor suppressor homolog isoform X1 [Trichogramma pretiosum]